ncbi:MAG: T9SS type A sorting domain-containing protein, partial [Bacteroidales bacterium]|nr:T9SS type A sorting domain-containing protein [Bacteroidales bacterium]
YEFKHWSDGVTTAKRTDSNVTASISVSAVFERITYTLSYTAAEGGSISGAATQTVEHGSSGVEVEAVPDEGYEFKHWSDGVTTAKRTDSNVTASISVSAVFEQLKESGGSTTSLFEVLQEVLSCYPNPTDGVVWVKDMPTSVIKYEVQVYNANGLLLRRIAPQEHVLIDLSAYPAGLYIIRVGNAMAKVVRR